MIEHPKCCATCRRMQPDNNYCHRRKETRYNVLGDVNCDYWAKSWNKNYNRGSIKVKFDALSWVGV
jgi:hypothetical protein